MIKSNLANTLKKFEGFSEQNDGSRIWSEDDVREELIKLRNDGAYISK